ncbi:MAG: DUF3467 domain-containing protein [Candidatus Aenigmatarchaeota archaeon]|nr:MAG: DUF3467 domain-containing protein [Candidatus Aenigmarchaeota archaeon]
MEQRKVNVTVDHTEPAFFADTLTVTHGQEKFILDFTQAVPRFDTIGEERHQTINIKHKTLVLDPKVAKSILNVLKENLERYEQRFGQIKTPKPKKAKKTSEKQAPSNVASYIG